MRFTFTTKAGQDSKHLFNDESSASHSRRNSRALGMNFTTQKPSLSMSQLETRSMRRIKFLNVTGDYFIGGLL